MFIDSAVSPPTQLRRSEMFQAWTGPSERQHFAPTELRLILKTVIYKHLVPTGLVRLIPHNLETHFLD